MTTNQILDLIQEILFSVEEIINSEKTLAYFSVKEKMEDIKTSVCSKNSDNEIKKNIETCIRMIMEAPPQNIALGRQILGKLSLLHAKI